MLSILPEKENLTLLHCTNELLLLRPLILILIILFLRCENMSKPLASAKITTSFQVSIPKVIRAMLEAAQGDILLFFEKDGEIVIKTKV